MNILAVIMSLYKNDIVSYVSSAVESLLNQTYDNFDLFIICDGDINPLVSDYLNGINDSRVQIFRRAENLGLAHSLNELLSIIFDKNYTFIARMDADDISLATRFQKQIDFLNLNEDVDVVGGYISEIDEQGRDTGKIVKYPCGAIECRRFFMKRNPVAHPSVMFRKRFFEKIHGFYPVDFERNEDTRLWHEGYKNNCVINNVPEVLLRFRITDSMFKSRRNGRDFAKSQLRLRKLIAKDLGYGKLALLYAYAMYLLMISPKWLLKISYKLFR